MPAICGTAHARSQENRSRRLAERYLASLGLVMLLAEPSLPDQIRLSVQERISLKHNRYDGHPYWLRSGAEVENLLREIIASEPKACRSRGRVVVNLTIDQADILILRCAERRLIPLVGPTEMQASVGRIIETVEEIMRRMNRSGELKKLNREYAELRRDKRDMSQMSQVSRVPPYADWVDSRVAQVLESVSNLVQFTNL